MPNTFTHLGHTLTWQEHSPGHHTFIFISGFSGTQQVWGHWLEIFKPLGRCVTLDLPGHYPAQAPRSYSQLTQADLLELETKAVQAIAGERPVTLIGHSTGGLVAIGVAAHLPSVRRVIAFAPVVWGPLIGFLGIFQTLLHQPWGYPIFWSLYRPSQLSEAQLMQGMSLYARQPAVLLADPLAQAYCHALYPTYRQHQLWNMAVTLRFLETCDLRPLLQGANPYSTPTLVLHGEKDRVVPFVQGLWLRQNLRNITLPHLPAADHFLTVEDVPALTALITPWLAQHPISNP